eukprot:TRINITY_DN11524_c0_g1_i1.p1 TRINITY_DN11524_c0_g1~~TRINITY_DN11524_c0_g1_i1.p1  ORF type:complete len:193 (+),score=43.21 TRINITY_DN11524_c0_g1_i1:79-657(+)
MTSSLKILVISKGLGGGETGTKYQKIKSLAPLSIIPSLPEPNDAIEEGIEILQQHIHTYHPDIIIASSRGGKYLYQLIERGIYKGACLLISCMHTSGIIRPGIPFVVVHGVEDHTNPVFRVRMDMENASEEIARLVELEEGHSLGGLFEGDLLEGLLVELSGYRALSVDVPVQERRGGLSFLEDIAKRNKLV